MHRMREFELLGRKALYILKVFSYFISIFLRIGNIYMFVLNSSLEKPQFKLFQNKSFLNFTLREYGFFMTLNKKYIWKDLFYWWVPLEIHYGEWFGASTKQSWKGVSVIRGHTHTHTLSLSLYANTCVQMYVYIYISNSCITIFVHIPDNYWPLKKIFQCFCHIFLTQ